MDPTSHPVSTGGNVIELNHVKSPAASSGGAQAQMAPVAKPDWREQLSLKLERLKEKNGDASAQRSETPDEDFRQREFVRPGSPGLEIEVEAPARREYHPLAEKALERIDRAKASSTENILETPSEPDTVVSAPPEPEVSSRRRRSPRRVEKTERIEINLNQTTLQFESQETRDSASREDQVQSGLSAATLAPRFRAGLIDALFVFGCYLIFLLIVFFVPEFALLTKSSALGMSCVWLLIFLSYIGIFTGLGARTLGMDHEQLEVVSFQGSPITSREAGLRSFGYLVSLGCFGLGFLWALFDPQQLTWHDKISKTLVVQKSAAFPPPNSTD
ncbi:MAG: RDD family protein [Acidobacteria bacterium]|nr:RDD family protein [Acidobacteriota bacterium]MCI0721463.1 RDD family protein [Acidobacteriota bacterium]